MKNVDIYLTFIKLKLKHMVEYHKSFILNCLAQMASYGAGFLLIWIMVTQFKTMKGWGAYEVMFLYALNLASYALAGFFFFSPCTRLSELVRTGEFDEVLTKPMNSFLYLIFKEFNYGYINHITLSAIVMVLCISKLGMAVTPVKLLFLLLTMFSGGLIFASIFLLTAVPAFWMVNNNGLMSIFLFNMRDFTYYPISIYGKFLQVFLTFIMPYAFINFYPAQFFLGKSDFLMFHPVFQFLSPAVGVIFFFIAYLFWNFGISRYESTGS